MVYVWLGHSPVLKRKSECVFWEVGSGEDMLNIVAMLMGLLKGNSLTFSMTVQICTRERRVGNRYPY